MDKAGWKIFMLLPRMLLATNPGRSKSMVREVKSRSEKFVSFHWDSLLHLNTYRAETPRTNSNSSDQRKKAALRLVKKSELSRAARLLTSSDLAPPTKETASKLVSKHPSRTMGITQNLTRS